MKEIVAWPYGFRIVCRHSGIGRASVEPTTYEIEFGDLYRGGRGEVCVRCPRCGQEHMLAYMIQIPDQEKARAVAESSFNLQEAIRARRSGSA